MPVDDSLRRAWRETEYRVRLPRGGFAILRIGAPLPDSLHAFLRGPSDPWGFITAWNPMSVAQAGSVNRARQRELRDALRSAGFPMLAGAGVGPDGWREPGLFVAGIGFDALDGFCRRFRQAAIVRGHGDGEAELHALI
ncbi:MAG: DUF3293 domain-containing protein [Proteobacteria bacterium]|nr:DUF3293 domain-containing protein [Pseudomonadota bacterium]